MSEINIEVVYIDASGEQFFKALSIPEGSSAHEAIERSGVRNISRPPPEPILIGIFGERCKLETVLRDQDRIELYRQRLADPKAARRQRALK